MKAMGQPAIVGLIIEACQGRGGIVARDLAGFVILG
jgi:hypothetical protein